MLPEINSDTIFKATGVFSSGLYFKSIGDVHSRGSDQIISYIKSEKFIDILNSNEAICGVICTQAMSKKLRAGILALETSDPNWAFFSLVDFLARHRIFPANDIRSEVGTKHIHVADLGVKIGQNVILEPFVVVNSGSTLGDNVIIRSGAVLGLDTFQHQRTSKGLISPHHDGDLIVESNVEVGANCSLSKGFSYRNTRIGKDTKIDANCYIGHGAQIGNRVIIGAGAKILGHVCIGDDVFVGPGAVVSSRIQIGEGAKISLGSVVTKDVGAMETVSGNFAVPHKLFISHMKTLLLEGSALDE